MSKVTPLFTPTLVVLCKRPRLHQGKQRLAATLGAEVAFNIAQLLLNCALEDAKSWPGEVVLSPATADDAAWAQALLPAAQVLPQSTGNLGERINAVDQSLLSAGYQQRVYIGTDAPIHDQGFYQQVITALADIDVVLNRADDGGVTVMATGPAWPDLNNLPWSTEQLGHELECLCQQQGLKIGRVNDSYDIDLEIDLQRLIGDLTPGSIAARPARQQLLSYLETLDLNPISSS